MYPFQNVLAAAREVPEWWTNMIITINNAIVTTIRFFTSLTPAQILLPAFGIWVIALNFWFREFSKSVYVAYLVCALLYFAFCVMILSGRFP